jgi:hypothetical protein
MSPSPIDIYRRQIERELQAANTTEHTHRPALKTPVQAFATKGTATSPRARILALACGTRTFLYAVIDHVRAEFVRQQNTDMWSRCVRNHLLPRVFGLELLMAPYAVAHFKLGIRLAGCDLSPAQREK